MKGSKRTAYFISLCDVVLCVTFDEEKHKEMLKYYSSRFVDLEVYTSDCDEQLDFIAKPLKNGVFFNG